MNPSDSKSDNLVCLYCERIFRNKMARWSHERFCKSGPHFGGKSVEAQVAKAPAAAQKRVMEGQVPVGAHIMYTIVEDASFGHTGLVVESFSDAVLIVPTHAPGGELPPEQRITLDTVEGWWPKDSMYRNHTTIIPIQKVA